MVSELVNPEGLPLPQRNPWADYVFRPLLLAIMLGCIGISIIGLGRALTPGWWGGQLLIGMIVATIEAVYSFRWLIHPRSRGISVYRYRLVELGMLAIVLKVVNYIGQPWGEIWLNLQLILREPLKLFSLDYLLMLGLAFLAWVVTQGTMFDFESLYDPYTFRSERIPPLDKLAARFFWGGGFLIIVSGLTLLASTSGFVEGLTSLADFNRPSIGGLVLNVLVYFILGLIMLSQVRLTTLLTRWHIQRVTVAEGLGKRWAKYGLAFLAVVTLLVIFLPTGYSVGLFESASLAISLTMSVLISILQIILIILSAPLIWLFSLLGGDAPAQGGGSGFGPIPPPVSSDRRSFPWAEFLRSLIFWLVFTFTALYLIKTYLADHPELLDALKRFRPLGWLFGLLATLVVWLIQFVQAGIDLIPKRIELTPQTKGAKPTSARRRWPRLGRQSSREQILYYYLNTLERARQIGLVRQKYQTPYEFEPHLSHPIPEAEAEVDLLTKAFVHARYSRDQFDSEHAALVKTVWRRIRSALREARKQKEVEEKPDKEQ